MFRAWCQRSPLDSRQRGPNDQLSVKDLEIRWRMTLGSIVAGQTLGVTQVGLACDGMTP